MKKPVTASTKSALVEGGFMQRAGLALAEWSEKWFPDALVFALLGIFIVFCAGLLLGESPFKLATQGGKAFWTLVPFTMQMVMVIIGGFVVASAPPVYRVIQKMATIPKTPKGAVAFVACFSMLTSLLSWGFSLIFSGMLVRELTNRIKGMDYRAAGAAGYLGLGAVWALGLSSSAALLMATKGAIPPKLYEISGVIPLTQTLFIWPTAITAIASYHGFNGHRLLVLPGAGKCENGRRLRSEVRVYRYDHRRTDETGRMAGIQPVPDDRGVPPARLVHR